MEAGNKKEENARRKVPEELAFTKEEIKTMKMGSNCTVSSAASTGFGRPVNFVGIVGTKGS